MAPSIDKFCYQLPPENTACAYAHVLFCRGRGGGEVGGTPCVYAPDTAGDDDGSH